MENEVPSPIDPSFIYCKITHTQAKGIAIFKSLRELANHLITRFTSHDKLKLAMTCASFDQGFRCIQRHITTRWNILRFATIQLKWKTAIDFNLSSPRPRKILPKFPTARTQDYARFYCRCGYSSILLSMRVFIDSAVDAGIHRFYCRCGYSSILLSMRVFIDSTVDAGIHRFYCRCGYSSILLSMRVFIDSAVDAGIHRFYSRCGYSSILLSMRVFIDFTVDAGIHRFYSRCGYSSILLSMRVFIRLTLPVLYTAHLSSLSDYTINQALLNLSDVLE